MKKPQHAFLSPEEAARRHFLQLFGAAVPLGVAPWLAGCGGGRDVVAPAPGPGTGALEERTYYFNLGRSRPGVNYVVMAGDVRHRLVPVTPDHLAQARKDDVQVPEDAITHVAERVPMLSDGPQLCMVRGYDPAQPGRWYLQGLFTHIPRAVRASGLRKGACGGKDADALRARFVTACGGSLQAAAVATAGAANFCSQAGDFKDTFDTAVALIHSHPEIMSLDAATLDYIDQAIICTDAATFDLAVAIMEEGDGWMSQQESLDENGQPILDEQGDVVYIQTFDGTIRDAVGQALLSIMPRIKADPSLGVNVTGVDPAAPPASFQGQVWMTRDSGAGVPAAAVPPPSVSALRPLAAAVGGVRFTATNDHNSQGFRIRNATSSGRTVTFTVDNWYVRHLAIYAVYQDGAGNDIPISALPADTAAQFKSAPLNGVAAGFLGILGPQVLAFGIPIKADTTQSYTVTIPEMAASVRILASGLGTGAKPYPDTLRPGMVLTAVLDLALPSFFLALGAATGFAELQKYVSSLSSILISTLTEFFVDLFVDVGLVSQFGSPEMFTNLVPVLVTALARLLKNSASTSIDFFIVYLKTQVGRAAVIDKTPVVGYALLVAASLISVAEIAETAVEVQRSPWTYVYDFKLAHDLAVTVNRDPADTRGFPAGATRYQLTASCDGATPVQSGWLALSSAQQQQDALTYTFADLPAGGKVIVNVAFMGADSALVGAGSTGPVDNTLPAAALAITESLVPLTGATRYAHQQKLALDANRDHVWVDTTQVPGVPSPDCGSGSGNLCELVGITVCEPFAAVGYTWRASSSTVQGFGSGDSGQLYQFASVSTRADPQRGYMFSGGGFGATSRLAFDPTSATSNSFYIDPGNGDNIVRQVRMTGIDAPPQFDAPVSGRSVGRFHFASDAFLVCTNRRLVSINSARNVMEVLVPLAVPVADADAAANMAQTMASLGAREGLLDGPVCAAVTAAGHVLVLEQGNNRIQAFDTGGSAARLFAGNSSATFALKSRNAVDYLDLAVEHTGYIYVLVRDRDSGGVFALDLYTPDGQFLATTNRVNAGKVGIDLFRNAYTLNYEPLVGGSYVEPGISFWTPAT